MQELNTAEVYLLSFYDGCAEISRVELKTMIGRFCWTDSGYAFNSRPTVNIRAVGLLWFFMFSLSHHGIWQYLEFI